VLSEEVISSNVAGIQSILENLLQTKGDTPGSPPAILNNLVAFLIKLFNHLGCSYPGC
jgi:hypothetical protein